MVWVFFFHLHLSDQVRGYWLLEKVSVRIIWESCGHWMKYSIPRWCWVHISCFLGFAFIDQRVVKNWAHSKHCSEVFHSAGQAPLVSSATRLCSAVCSNITKQSIHICCGSQLEMDVDLKLLICKYSSVSFFYDHVVQAT